MSKVTKETNKPPKYSKVGKYAVIYQNRKPIYLPGLYGSPESKAAYARFEAEWWSNGGNRSKTTFQPFGKESVAADTTVRELCAAFLEHVEVTLASVNYTHYRIVVLDFLKKLYGDIPADNFKPSCLKLVRTEMIRSGRFCRNHINSYVTKIVRVFSWGVEEELVQPNTALALKAVKSLPPGAPGTFDHPEPKCVPDGVIAKTLPFLTPILKAMVLILRLTAMRPSELFVMTPAKIDRTRGNGLWYYRLPKHKTALHVGAKEIPLGKAVQKLFLPYLEGKADTKIIFSPQTAVLERNAIKRANRKTALTPSQTARDAARGKKSRKYNEAYNKDSFRTAIQRAVCRANKTLPPDEQIEQWNPYMLRRAAGTAIEIAEGLDKSQAMLGHRSPNPTRRYAKGQLKIAEEVARKQENPFDTEEEHGLAGSDVT